MATCRNCGERIERVNWYDGPGWMHEYTRTSLCPPVTQAEPTPETED